MTPTLRAILTALNRNHRKAAPMTDQTTSPADRAALRDRIADTLAEQFTPDGKTTQGMRVSFQGPDGWPATRQPNPSEVADAVLPVLPAPVGSAAALSDTERQFLTFALDGAAEEMSLRDGFTDEDRAALERLRRMADEAQQPETQPTPCSEPDACEDGELCDVHEVEQCHADGEHEHCGATCEVQFPSAALRIAVLFRAIPGAAGMLDELLRRTAEGAQQPNPCSQQDATEPGPACDHRCTCGHDEQDHSTSGWCHGCGDQCDKNDGHYPGECPDA